jgi:hypothetical protein
MTAEEFVRLWQECDTLDEFADKSGIDKGLASCRAARYRRHGVGLRKHTGAGRSPLDYDRLHQIAEEAGNADE